MFLAGLLAIAALSAAGLVLVRWKWFEDSALAHRDRAASVELPQLDELIESLSARYRQHRDWAFLPASAAQRKSWLREEWMRSRQSRDARPDAARPSMLLGYRIGLFDAHGAYLAGVVASPSLVAFASIDRAVRAVVVDGQTVATLVVAGAQNPDEELVVAFLLDQQRNLFVIAMIGLLLSALAAALLAANFRRPIAHLVDGARKLGRGGYDTRLDIRRSDELGELASTFNQLAARLDETERLRRQWVADTSHELRTPLSVLQGQLEALQDGVRRATPENLELMLRQARSLTRLVDELHRLASSDAGALIYDKRACDLWEIVEESFADFEGRFAKAGLTATVAAAPARPIVYCDVGRVRQVMTNLLENCVRYTATGGRVEASAWLTGNEMRVTLDDSAPGVPTESLDRLGERFFRLEPSRSRELGGAGLGLALSRQIVMAHGGRIEFASSPLGGLRVSIVLPLDGRE